MSHERLKKTLFKLARSNASGLFIGFAFENLSNLIPVDKIAENDKVLVFYHPVKHWEKHVLIVPKKAIRNFLSFDLNRDTDRDTIMTVFEMATHVAREQEMEKYTILVNGGDYQDVPQVHFHLASGKDKQGNPLGEEMILDDNASIIFESKQTKVQKASDPNGKEHLILYPKIKVATIRDLDLNDETTQSIILDSIRTAQEMVHQLNPKGYTLLTNQGGEKNLVFHLLYE